ncbi:TPA: hypothetical protein ACXJLS_000376 [Stenotrophomonas maltophilia]
MMQLLAALLTISAFVVGSLIGGGLGLFLLWKFVIPAMERHSQREEEEFNRRIMSRWRSEK